MFKFVCVSTFTNANGSTKLRFMPGDVVKKLYESKNHVIVKFNGSEFELTLDEFESNFVELNDLSEVD